MSTDIFPTLAGLGWDMKKVPTLSTRVSKGASGKEVRAANQAYPIWTFELNFPVLRDRPSNDDLHNLLGFYLAHTGPFDTWLYRDVTDYQLATQVLGTGDGTTTDFTFTRQLGTAAGCVFREPVGYVDTLSSVGFAPSAVNTSTDLITVPGHGLSTGDGPFLLSATVTKPNGTDGSTFYWIVAASRDQFGLAVSASAAAAGTLVNITSQGSGNIAITRNALAYINGTPQAKSAFNIIAPNTLRFTSVTPGAGDLVTADFSFLYNCRFSDDHIDPSNMALNLWQLGQLSFQSVL